MNLWTRLADLAATSLATLLEDADDPEAQVARIIRDLERGLAGVKAHAAGAIAAERRLAREIQRQKQRTDHWREQGMQALTAGQTERREQARLLQREHAELLGGLQLHHDAACQVSASARISLRILEVRLLEARQVQKVLRGRRDLDESSASSS